MNWSLQELETDKNGYKDWNTYAIRNEQNCCIAIVGEVDVSTSTDNLYNAKLMQKAPKLLNALKDCMETLKLKVPNIIYYPKFDDYESLIKEIEQ